MDDNYSQPHAPLTPEPHAPPLHRNMPHHQYAYPQSPPPPNHPQMHPQPQAQGYDSGCYEDWQAQASQPLQDTQQDGTRYYANSPPQDQYVYPQSQYHANAQESQPYPGTQSARPPHFTNIPQNQAYVQSQPQGYSAGLHAGRQTVQGAQPGGNPYHLFAYAAGGPVHPAHPALRAQQAPLHPATQNPAQAYPGSSVHPPQPYYSSTPRQSSYPQQPFPPQPNPQRAYAQQAYQYPTQPYHPPPPQSIPLQHPASSFTFQPPAPGQPLQAPVAPSSSQAPSRPSAPLAPQPTHIFEEYVLPPKQTPEPVLAGTSASAAKRRTTQPKVSRTGTQTAAAKSTNKAKKTKAATAQAKVPPLSSTEPPRPTIPPNATVDSLLSTGFVPPLLAIGGELSLEETISYFTALSLHDKREILRAYLHGPSHDGHAPVADARKNANPVFTFGASSAPKTSTQVPDSDPRSSAAPPQPQPSSATSCPTKSRYQTTVEDADSDSDNVTTPHTGYRNGKQRSDPPMARGTTSPFSFHPGAVPASQPMSSAGGSTHFGIRILDAVHTIKEQVDRRLDDMQMSIEDIHGKLSEFPPETKQSASESEPRTPRPGPQMKKPRPRSTAARIQKATATEDFTEQLAAVISDDEEGGATTTPRRSSRQTAAGASTAPQQFDDAKERAHLKRLGECVRTHLDEEMLKIKHVKELPHKFPALTQVQVKAISESREPVITSRENFFLDFTNPLKTFVPNRMAADFFVEDFRAAVAGGCYQHPPIPARYLTYTQVFAALENHVSHLRSEFSRLTMPVNPENILKQQQREQAHNASARQNTTLKTRKETVLDEDFGLQRHHAIVFSLKPRHISPDVPAYEVAKGDRCRVFHITEAMWQSRPYKDFMRGLDKIAKTKKKKGGNLPRERLELKDPKWIDSDAPNGLWKNCYSDEWLSKQTYQRLKELQMIDEDYDFSLDPRP